MNKTLSARVKNLIQRREELEWLISVDTGSLRAAFVNVVNYIGVRLNLRGKLANNVPYIPLSNDPWDIANARIFEGMHYLYRDVRCENVIRELYLANNALSAWRAARELNDYELVKPQLASLISCRRDIIAKQAASLSEIYPNDVMEPFDAALFQETGLATGIIDKFADDIVDFSFQARQMPRVDSTRNDRMIADGHFSVSSEKQRELIAALTSKLPQIPGAKIAESTDQSLCLGYGEDTMMAIKIDEQNVIKTLLAFVHEYCGHVNHRYHAGLSGGDEWKDHPVAQVAGAAGDESAAIFIEVFLMRTPEGAEMLENLLKDSGIDHISREDIYEHMMASKNGTRRNDADPLRYPVEALLALNIGRLMYDPDIGNDVVENLPGVWNIERQALKLDDARDFVDGCGRDRLMYVGREAYIPAYLLGFLGAAQLYKTYRQQGGAHDLTDGMKWIADNYSVHGHLYTFPDLMEHVTGVPLSPDAYFEIASDRWTHHVHPKHQKPAYVSELSR